MTREELITIVGEGSVAVLETMNCEPTSRAYDRKLLGDEWVAYLDVLDLNGEPCTIEVYYYTNKEDDAIAEESGDWGMVTFTPHHYEIV